VEYLNVIEKGFSLVIDTVILLTIYWPLTTRLYGRSPPSHEYI